MHKKRRRVILLTQYLSTGGLEYMVLHHARTLLEQGRWEPIVLAYTAPVHGANLEPAFREAGVRVYTYKKGQGFSLFTALWILWIALRFQTRILHSHDLGPLVYGILARIFSLGVLKLVHTQHSFSQVEKKKRHRFYEQTFVKLANHVCIVSDHLRQTYIQWGVKASCLSVVPNGIVFPAQYPKSKAERQSRRKELLLTLGTELGGELEKFQYWLLSLGRVAEKKGQETALALWSMLRKKEGWALVIVGPEQELGYTEKLQALVPADGGVFFAGATEKSYDWYASADLYLSTSKVEGMPLAPIEALASNLPVVLSDISGHKELFAHATVIPLGDEKMAAGILEKKIRECEAGFCGAPINAVRDRYRALPMTLLYEAIYSRLSHS